MPFLPSSAAALADLSLLLLMMVPPPAAMPRLTRLLCPTAASSGA